MAECPKLASKLRLMNTDIIKCQQLMYRVGQKTGHSVIKDATFKFFR